MRKLDLALLIGLVAAIIVSNFTSFEKSYEKLQNGVLRLHILANSDSDEDQALKIKVRDRLLEYSGELFGENLDMDEVEKLVANKLDRIKEIAEDVIKKNGFSYIVDCKLLNMEFNTRTYDDITMPAGNYDAIRITIGEAKGKNWWCVMYPPLCVPAASAKNDKKDENKTISASKDSEQMFDDGEYDILKNPKKYEVKFKILEIYEDVKKKIKK